MKEQRQEALREILTQRRVGRQDELVAALTEWGIEATQSSVSRDLRELRVSKVGGVYRVPEDVDGEDLQEVLGGALRSYQVAGPHLLVVHTVVGGASRAGLAIDDAHWPEVVGTVAGDDTLFLATPSAPEQNRVIRRLKEYLLASKGQRQ